MTHSQFSRRGLLRGLGAGSLLLGSFARSIAWAATPSKTGNFLVFFTPNGHVRKLFGADGTADDWTFRNSLAPLQPYQKSVTVLAGLCCKSSTSKASHEDCTRILTCVTGDDMYQGYGPSIDHSLGKALGDQRPMTLAVDDSMPDPNWQTKISWIAPQANDPHVKDPRQVYSTLFSNLMPSGAPAQVDHTLDQDKSVLDFVLDDITSFSGRLSGKERSKLDLHLDAVRQLEKNLTAVAPVAGAICTPATVKTAVDGSVPPDSIQRLKQQGELMVDLVATAFSCGVRRLGTLLWQPPSGGVNPVGMTSSDHHQVSHYTASNDGTVWPLIDGWYAARFAYLMKRLSDLQILDNTIVVWASELSEQHNQNNMTMLVAGGRALGIQSGKNIKFDFFGDEGGNGANGGIVSVARDPRNTSLSDLWVSVQKAMGVNSDHFGDQQWSAGGLKGLYAPV